MSNEGRSAMRAVVMDRFGGPEVLEVRDLPVPEVGPGEVLIRVEAAGVGEWDPFEREGGYAKMFGIEPRFPYILGSEGAGTVAAVGEGVNRFEEGDRVYAAGFLNPKGGFYAEYAAVDAGLVSGAPNRLPTEQAGAPVVLVDGRMEGVWRHERRGDSLSVGIEPFARQPDWVRRAAEEEAERLWPASSAAS